jgi:alpha-mannosidase
MGEKFGVDPDDLVIDFEPDTFGHSRNIPEILDSGGVRYYYHCRGQVGEKVLYRWKAPSGKDVVVYTEPFWYNAEIDTFTADYAPELARLTGGAKLLKVYGVGDHGGGPTRRDINRIIEMNSWPLYPKFSFGSLRGYFDSTADRKEKLPVLDDEINFLCDGCYTTQTRIKAGNRKAERLMKEAEWYSVSAMISCGKEYPASLLGEAWRKILFNQFHDIIPGSGVAETREYASGLYQEIFAAAESARTIALEAVAGGINTGSLQGSSPAGTDASRGEGAGAGFGQTGRSAGLTRVYHVFNPLPFDRKELVPITVWDYEGSTTDAAIRDAGGNEVEFQHGESGEYWGHHFDTLIARLSVPAAGYSSVVIEEKKNYGRNFVFINDMRVQKPDTFVLENGKVKVTLDPRNGSIASFIDRESGAELAGNAGKENSRDCGIFRLARESVYKGVTNWHPGMSAWFEGRYKEITNITENIEIIPVRHEPRREDDLYGHTDAVSFGRKTLRGAFLLRTRFGSGSSLEAAVSLDEGSKRLRYDVTCDWREFGSDEAGGAPNLHFYLPLNYAPRFLFDVPFGTTYREGADMDLPAESFVLAENSRGPVSLALFSMDKYGFRCLNGNGTGSPAGTGNSMSLTLIRGAYAPDSTPETGRHRFSFAVVPFAAGPGAAMEAVRESLAYRHPCTVISGKFHGGPLAAEGSLLSLEGGSVVVSAVKRSEAGGKRILFRVYEIEGKKTRAVFRLGFRAKSAYLTGACETKRTGEARLDGGELSFDLLPFSVRAVILELE